jgi:FkbM family methyltransferase
MQKTINQFVYQRILESEMPNSTIPAWLSETYTQAYEDVIIDSSIRAYIRRNPPNKGISLSYLEIGANHPVCTSASYYFQRKYNIRGILVEANPKLIPALKKYRPHDIIIHAAVCNTDHASIDFYISPDNEISSLDPKFVNNWKDMGIQEKITVPTIRINALLEMLKADITLLSIDVEGLDMMLLEDIDYAKYNPTIIQVEPSDGYAPGTSTKMINFLSTKGYTLVGETDVNLIFETTHLRK